MCVCEEEECCGVMVCYVICLCLPGIGSCTQLAFLEMQHNELQALPHTVGNLTMLKRLVVR